MLRKALPVSFLLVSLLISLISVSTFAFTEQMNFQGRLTNTGGTPITGSKNVTFRLFDSVSTGTKIGTDQTRTVICDPNGVFSALVSFESSLFDGSDRWIEVQVVGDLDPMSPRQKVAAVPYAYTTIAGGGWTDDGTKVRLTNIADNVGIGTASPGRKLDVIGDVGIVQSSTALKGIQLQIDNGGQASSRIFFDETGNKVYGFSWLSTGLVNPTLGGTSFTLPANFLYLLYHNGTATGEIAMTIYRGNGYVGIGTAAPVAPLHVSHDYHTVNHDFGQMILTGATNVNQGVSIGYNTTDDYGYIQARVVGTGHYNLAINPSGGAVCSGTTEATSKLHVTGLPVYADNASAKTGGHTAGAFYRTSTGALMVVY